jgi:hypothetical protein
MQGLFPRPINSPEKFLPGIFRFGGDALLGGRVRDARDPFAISLGLGADRNKNI